MMRGDERDEREREGKGGVGRAEKREEKREEQIPNWWEKKGKGNKCTQQDQVTYSDRFIVEELPASPA